MELPSSVACLRNRDPILKVLATYIVEGSNILEIGHGTGEHAEYFARHLPVNWHAADQKENNWMLVERLKQSSLDNIIGPIELSVGPIPLKKVISEKFDAVYSANTLHIMSEKFAYQFCEEVADLIESQGYLFLYGPFKFEGQFTSESNQRFDGFLKERDPLSGIRDFEELKARLEKSKIDFLIRHDLPANNQLLVFQKNA